MLENEYLAMSADAMNKILVGDVCSAPNSATTW